MMTMTMKTKRRWRRLSKAMGPVVCWAIRLLIEGDDVEVRGPGCQGLSDVAMARLVAALVLPAGENKWRHAQLNNSAADFPNETGACRDPRQSFSQGHSAQRVRYLCLAYRVSSCKLDFHPYPYHV